MKLKIIFRFAVVLTLFAKQMYRSLKIKCIIIIIVFYLLVTYLILLLEWLFVLKVEHSKGRSSNLI